MTIGYYDHHSKFKGEETYVYRGMINLLQVHSSEGENQASKAGSLVPLFMLVHHLAVHLLNVLGKSFNI